MEWEIPLLCRLSSKSSASESPLRYVDSFAQTLRRQTLGLDTFIVLASIDLVAVISPSIISWKLSLTMFCDRSVCGVSETEVRAAGFNDAVMFVCSIFFVVFGSFWRAEFPLPITRGHYRILSAIYYSCTSTRFLFHAAELSWRAAHWTSAVVSRDIAFCPPWHVDLVA